ncbi:MAG: glutamate-1-semialdehyde 2,1-aminomutase [Cytophagales bacterium]
MAYQETINSNSLFEKAKKIIPGGVNSPVRAFKSVGGNPVFIKSAKGAYLFDEDGNKYIDYIGSWGPMIMGHAFEPVIEAIRESALNSTSFGAPTEKEVEMASLLTEVVPSLEMVRMVNSGTEATMAAIRVARGFTGKEKIIKFEGCYHGHGDSFLIAAGSGAMTMGVPDSPGVTQATANDTLTAAYNNLESVNHLVDANKDKIAAIIVEPVVGNMGCVLPKPGFLEGLRSICDKHNIVLIFDEVMTGFRLSIGGAQKRFGITPDLTTLGKIIGGGMPVGAYGGKKEIMEQVAPVGKVYQAGTLSGNPVAMSAGLALLKHLIDNPSVYVEIENSTIKLAKGFELNHKNLGVNFTINQIGSMISVFFTNQNVTDFESAKSSDTVLFGKYFHEMLKRGVYLAPSQFESLFISNCIKNEEVAFTIEKHRESLEIVLNER